MSHADESTRWNPAGRRDRPGVENLKRAMANLSLVERQVRGIARAFADTPAGQSLPAEVEGPLSRLLTHVAGELGAWAAEATAGTAKPETRDDAGLYQDALSAVRTFPLSPQLAAIATATAVDAHRISEELRWEPVVPAPRRHGWRALFEAPRPDSCPGRRGA